MTEVADRYSLLTDRIKEYVSATRVVIKEEDTLFDKLSSSFDVSVKVGESFTKIKDETLQYQIEIEKLLVTLAKQNAELERLEQISGDSTLSLNEQRKANEEALKQSERVANTELLIAEKRLTIATKVARERLKIAIR